MSEWQIELVGDEKDIELLEIFFKDTTYHIDTWEGRKLLTLPEVSPNADSEFVRAASNKIIDIINGAAKLYYKHFRGLSFFHVSRFDESGKRVGFGYLTAPAQDFTLTAINPEDRTLFGWINLALDDEEIERALFLFGSLEQNWKNLYMVLEVLEDSFGGEAKLLIANLAPSDDIKLFKRTACSYKAIGRDARHGTLSFEPPLTPMALDKAQKLMRTLLQEWIKFKVIQST